MDFTLKFDNCAFYTLIPVKYSGVNVNVKKSRYDKQNERQKITTAKKNFCNSIFNRLPLLKWKCPANFLRILDNECIYEVNESKCWNLKIQNTKKKYRKLMTICDELV